MKILKIRLYKNVWIYKDFAWFKWDIGEFYCVSVGLFKVIKECKLYKEVCKRKMIEQNIILLLKKYYDKNK